MMVFVFFCSADDDDDDDNVISKLEFFVKGAILKQLNATDDVNQIVAVFIICC